MSAGSVPDRLRRIKVSSPDVDPDVDPDIDPDIDDSLFILRSIAFQKFPECYVSPANSVAFAERCSPG